MELLLFFVTSIISDQMSSPGVLNGGHLSEADFVFKICPRWLLSRYAVEQLRATLELPVVIKVWIKAKLVPLIIV